MEKSGASLNFLSLEITISVCVHKIYSCYVNMYMECAQYGSLIIFLILSSVGQVCFFFFFLVMSKYILNLCPWMPLVLIFIIFLCVLRVSQNWMSMSLIWFTLCWFSDLWGFVFFNDSVSLLTLPHPVLPSQLLFSYLNPLFQSPLWFFFFPLLAILILILLSTKMSVESLFLLPVIIIFKFLPLIYLL